MHIHILGIGGTFMAGIAVLARSLGHTVTGSDAKVYPPMSTQLEHQGIVLREGYLAQHLEPRPDLVVIGNALSRGNAAVEAVLELGLPYTSGAQWLAENVLRGRWVLAVAGTHGKTSTASMLAWILDSAGLTPGFLIGGVPENFGVSARLGAAPAPGQTPLFVVEADEYDTAFFDKRSKFLHYRPRTAVLNNLEYDHADIFPNLDAIKLQFHHFVRTVPPNGRLIVRGDDPELAATLRMGCWTPVESFCGEGAAGTTRAADRFDAVARWSARPEVADASRFEVFLDGASIGHARWALAGRHNMHNALAAIAAARHAGVPVASAQQALAGFRNAKRRLELRAAVNGIAVYDDFAHHPTAIAATLDALRARVGNARIVAVLEPRSNTMRMGVHRDTLGPALSLADRVLIFRPADLTWNLERVTRGLDARGQVFDSVTAIVEQLAQELRPGDHVLIMSNGGFENIHVRLIARLQGASTSAWEKQA
jgi:UDP-N-acetylmuramate: L-alanyl-gamma-D-glutamyl-meso-diaminopimelate ligase